jgi:hypothetical protein
MAKSARLTACALTLLLALPTPVAAQLETRRFPLADPKQVAAGTFFAEHAALLASSPSWETEEMRAMGGSEQRAALADVAGRLDDDVLARELIRALDAVRSAELTIRVLRGLFPDEPAFLAQVDAAQHMVNMPDGSTRRLPLVQAWRLQRGLARMAARSLAMRPAAASLAGTYAGKAEGTDCPVESGPIELVQQGRAVELVREGRLLFSVVMGTGELAALATEQRHATVTRGAEGAQINAPDRASEVYVAPLGSQDLVLAGSKFLACTVTLTAKR